MGDDAPGDDAARVVIQLHQQRAKHPPTYNHQRNATNVKPSTRSHLCTQCLLLFLLTACRTPQTLQTDTTREVRIVERDTLITIAPDSATVRALLECDSTNQVILRQLSTRNGNRIAATATLLSPSKGEPEGVSGKVLSVVCHEDSLTRLLHLRDSVITTLRTEQRTIEVPAPLTRWQSFCLVLGQITIALLTTAFLTLIIFVICKFLIKH